MINESKNKWDLNVLLEGKSFEEKRIECHKRTDKFVLKWKERKDYLENPEVLKESLEDYEKWFEDYKYLDEELYFYLKQVLDQSDSEIKANLSLAENFSREIGNKIRFFMINISGIEKEKQKYFVEDSSLTKYKHFLEMAFACSDHVLSEKEEKMMSSKHKDSYSRWVDMIEDFLSREERKVIDEDGNEIDATYEKLLSLINSKNKEVRDKAAEAFNDILKKLEDVAEVELNAILNYRKVEDELRGFSRPDHSRVLEDDIDFKFVDTLVESVSERFDITKRYYELKAKLLKVKKLKYHERNVEYGNIPQKYNYRDSLNLVYNSLNKIDPEFGDIIKKYSNEGRLDAFPKKGKIGGAACISLRKNLPVYLFFNHTDSIRDVKVIAHEFGHGINYEFIRKKQPSIYFDTSKSTTEVASTFMEDFAFKDILKEANDETKLTLYMSKLGDELSTIFRQVACYKLEQELHFEFRKKGYLSKEEIGKIFQKNMSAYMGDFVEQSPGSENWWIYWSHLRKYFYVYSYSSGLLISKYLQRKFREDNLFINNIKEFFSAGTSESPKESFNKMGIDIYDKCFWEQGLKEVEDLLNETENLAKKLGKI